MSSVPSLTSLLKQTHIDDHEEILKAANSTLKQSKTDIEAQHVKVVALLKLDRFDDAIHAFESGGDTLKEKARLEYAYALYKTGKPADAADIARQGTGRGSQHVQAQASYRIEDFSRAMQVYGELSKQLEQDAEADLRINSSAVDAQLEWAGQGGKVDRSKGSRREDMEAFEMMYNHACDSIAQGALGRAEILLKRARDLCSRLEDEEERQSELQPITVQQVYVLARQGRTLEAEQLATSIHPEGISDASTKYIAQINSMAANPDSTNPFLMQRKIARDIESLRPDYPFEFQAGIMKQNRYATDLQSMKFSGTAESTEQIISKKESPSLDSYHTSLSAVNAAAHAQCRSGKEGLKLILPLLAKRPTDVGLILTLVQLYVLTGNSASAINLLEGFLDRLEQSATPDARFAPGLVGTAVSLYESAGRGGKARTELVKAATHWRRRARSEAPAGVTHLLKTAGSSLLESSVPEEQALAKDIFTDLHQADEKDRYAAAGLLASAPESAPTDQSSSLQPIDRLIADIDIDSLEQAGIAQPLATEAAVSTRKRPAEDTKPKKAKKIRPSRLPKDYDPSKQPDPERWLPLKDRSTYRPKGKKGKARQAMLAQGAAPATDSDGSRPGTPGGEVIKGKQQGGGGGKKKKGKGGKW